MENNKTLLVTGASSDVGMALLKRLAGGYGRVIAHYRTMSNAFESLINDFDGKIVPIKADFCDEAEVDRFVRDITAEECGIDHIVLLPAPKAFNQRFERLSWADFQKGIDVQLRSAVKILSALMPAMAKKHYGRVVFMLTSCVRGLPPKYQSHYVTVKYALMGLQKCLAAEYAAKGITVNAVSPDMMETKFLSCIQDVVVRQNAQTSPLGRNLKAEDVVGAFCYLLSEEAAAVTGENIVVAGGIK